MLIMYIVAGVALFYLMFTLFLAYMVHRFPRNPVKESPDWGTVIDIAIPAQDGGKLEVWRIEPEGDSRGIVVFAHGWGRNRDRMVGRARMFAQWGFTTVLHSARDHGNSSPKKLMNAVRFAEDIESVLEWVAEPVILYGHSAGSAGAILAAARNPAMIRMLFLEASYADAKEGLLSLYRWFNPVFGFFFARMILSWMNLFYRGALDRYSPVRLAKHIRAPVMIIHGEQDKRFPLRFARELKRSFPHENVSIYIAEGADHSDSSLTPGYPHAVKSFLDRLPAE
ncbi:MAG: alpha/beta fold hydrolase [Desulfobacterales bacterium]